MAQYDGSIRINTKIDTKDAKVQLVALQHTIVKTADEIASLRSMMDAMKDVKFPTKEFTDLEAELKITAIREIQLSYGIPRYIAAGAQRLLLLENGIAAEISEVSLADGSILSTQSLASSSYSLGEETPDMYVEDFRIQEDGSVEILWADPATARGVRETLQLKEIERIPIVLATPYTIPSWMLGKIAEFNQTNDTYHVILKPLILSGLFGKFFVAEVWYLRYKATKLMKECLATINGESFTVMCSEQSPYNMDMDLRPVQTFAFITLEDSRDYPPRQVVTLATIRVPETWKTYHLDDLVKRYNRQSFAAIFYAFLDRMVYL